MPSGVVSVEPKDRLLEARVLGLHAVPRADARGSPAHDLVDDVTGYVIVRERRGDRLAKAMEPVIGRERLLQLLETAAGRVVPAPPLRG